MPSTVAAVQIISRMAASSSRIASLDSPWSAATVGSGVTVIAAMPMK